MRVIAGKIGNEVQENTAVTLGKFDGIHLGHQKLIREVLKSKDKGQAAAVFTFQRAPRELLGEAHAPVLLTNREKRIHMERLGVDYLVEYPFNMEIMHMDAEDFLREVLIKGLHAKKIITGPDYHFGYKRKGDVAFLRANAEKYGYEVKVIEKERADDNEVISSSLIRKEIAKGNIERANELLGYPYTVTGEVVHGNHLGRTFGVPTINQIPEQEKLLPPNGVYASMVKVDDIWYKAVSNVGYKPTIEGNYPKGVETCIFDFDQDVYGRTLDVMFFHYQRPEQKFKDLTALIAQLQRDTDGSKDFFAMHPEINF